MAVEDFRMAGQWPVMEVASALIVGAFVLVEGVAILGRGRVDTW
jgi:hypothetical protein